MQEAFEAKKKRARKIFSILSRAYPSAKCSLDFKTPLQLLVATMLSAQCTDERVNKVTPALFAKYKNAEDFAKSDLAALESIIYPTGFYRAKARHIREACRIIAENFNGRVPDKMEHLLSLPGVGRKTANIVLGNAYGVFEGIPVDTHATRISRLLGLTAEKQPDKIEADLMALLPKRHWLRLSNLFIYHGRRVCTARNPACGRCQIERLCPKIGLKR